MNRPESEHATCTLRWLSPGGLPGRHIGSLLLLLCGWLTFSQAFSAPKARFDYFLTGSADDVVPVTRPPWPSSLLMGGGPDVDAAFGWMIARAGGGDLVVLRTRGADGYNQYLYDMGGLDSVETFVLRNAQAANDPFVIDRVLKAEAVFIAGGDQSDYIRMWKGTALDEALKRLIRPCAAELATGEPCNVPIGGTSAGLAVEGEFDFAALRGTIDSDRALQDPYIKRVTLDRDFLSAPGLADTIADAHLDTRDRMGRLVTFVARIVQDRWSSVDEARGIGLSVATALAVENDVAIRFAQPEDDGSPERGSAYFLKPVIAPTICEPKQPLTFRNVQVQRLSGSGTFDLRFWQAAGDGVTTYELSVESGVLLSSQSGGSAY